MRLDQTKKISIAVAAVVLALSGILIWNWDYVFGSSPPHGNAKSSLKPQKKAKSPMVGSNNSRVPPKKTSQQPANVFYGVIWRPVLVANNISYTVRILTPDDITSIKKGRVPVTSAVIDYKGFDMAKFVGSLQHNVMKADFTIASHIANGSALNVMKFIKESEPALLYFDENNLVTAGVTEKGEYLELPPDSERRKAPVADDQYEDVAIAFLKMFFPAVVDTK